MNRSFTKDIGVKNKPRKKCSTSFIVREQVKNHAGISAKNDKVWSSPTWLAEFKTVLPLWKSLAVSYTVQLPFWMTCNPITSYLSNWNENLCGHKNLYMIICSGFFPKDPKLDNPTIQMHLTWGVENKLRYNRTTEYNAALKRSEGRVHRTTRRTPSASCMLSFVGHSGKSKTIETETDEWFQGLEVWGEATYKMTRGNPGWEVMIVVVITWLRVFVESSRTVHKKSEFYSMYLLLYVHLI